MQKGQLIIALTVFVFQGFSQQSFDEKITTVSNVRMTINNVGTFGNAFGGSYDVLGYSSAEFPANSGIEHMFEAGIWVGALIDGSNVAVSSAAYDQTSGYSPGRAGYEFTGEIGNVFEERSSLIDNPNYSPEAISHQDFVADYSDKNILVPGTQIQIIGHDNPMNLDVHFESYNWNYSFSDAQFNPTGYVRDLIGSEDSPPNLVSRLSVAWIIIMTIFSLILVNRAGKNWTKRKQTQTKEASL